MYGLKYHISSLKLKMNSQETLLVLPTSSKNAQLLFSECYFIIFCFYKFRTSELNLSAPYTGKWKVSNLWLPAKYPIIGFYLTPQLILLQPWSYSSDLISAWPTSWTFRSRCLVDFCKSSIEAIVWPRTDHFPGFSFDNSNDERTYGIVSQEYINAWK